MSSSRTRLLVTCEHGGNQVPSPYAEYFEGLEQVLNSHRGYDLGALPLARDLADRLSTVPLVYAEVTRLVVDLNRSATSRSLVSEYLQGVSRAGRTLLMDRYYRPYRAWVADCAEALMADSSRLIHLSVHSFTPVFKGRPRTADIGLLYNPDRLPEKAFCRQWKTGLVTLLPDLRVRFNWPYRGTADGLVRSLRSLYPSDRYLGIELEVNQGLVAEDGRFPQILSSCLADSLDQLISRPS